MYLTEQRPDSPVEALEITPEMIEAAKAALIAWHEGSNDFRDGAISILEAAMAARGESVDWSS